MIIINKNQFDNIVFKILNILLNHQSKFRNKWRHIYLPFGGLDLWFVL